MGGTTHSSAFARAVSPSNSTSTPCIMSGEQASDQRPRRPSHTAAFPQHLPFVGPIPNMLPFNPAEATRATATTSPLFYPNAPPFTTPFIGNISGIAPFSGHASPFSSPNLATTAPPHRTGEPLGRDGDFHHLPHTAKVDAMAVTDSNSRDSVDTTHSPATYPHQGNKRSRLPSDNVARKAPRKAGYIDHSSPPQRHQTKPQKTKKKSVRERPTEQNVQTKDESPVSRNATPNSIRTRQSRRQSTPLNREYVQASTVASRNRRLVLDEDDEIDSPCASIKAAHVSTEALPSTDRPSPFPQPDSALQHTHNNPRGDIPIQSLRPRYTYPVPLELEGVQKALGPDNWNEYLVHMENLWTGEISGEDFAARTKRLFLVFDDSIRKRMNNLMAMKTVVPVLEQCTREEEQRRKEAQGGENSCDGLANARD